MSTAFRIQFLEGLFNLRQLVEFEALVGKPTSVPATIDWGELENRLGIEFPQDYREWANRYPSLEIDGFLWVRHPAEFYIPMGVQGILQELDGISNQHWERDSWRLLHTQSGERVANPPVPTFYPDRHGWVPWGSTDNGDTLLWKMDSETADWKICVVDMSCVYWQEFDCGFLEFLVRMLRNELYMKVLPDDFPKAPRVRYFVGYELNLNQDEVAKFVDGE